MGFYQRAASPRSFRSALLVFVLGSLALTIGAVGVLAFMSSVRTIETLRQRQFVITAALLERGISGLLDPAPKRLATMHALGEAGTLPLEDPEQLGLLLASELRFEPNLSWLSYANAKTGEFIGARRKASGELVINVSSPLVEQGRPREFPVGEDGIVRKDGILQDTPYDPRTREWFQNAVKSHGQEWSEVYFFSEGEPGLTLTQALRRDGEVVGVFTADYTLEAVNHFLDALTEQRASFVGLFTRNGELIGHGSSSPQDGDELWQATMAALPVPITELEEGSSVGFRYSFSGKTMLGSAMILEPVDGFVCVAVAAGDERHFFGPVLDNARNTIWIGLIALAGAALISFFIAGKLAQPLMDISADLNRVAEFDLTRQEVRESVPSEIVQLSESVEKMKAGLRSFSRYVPTQLVRKLVVLGQEAELGGMERDLTILFADLAGFTKFSETLSPSQTVEEMRDYFEMVTAAVEEQEGILDKFIGDGVLAFFNAPHDVPAHPIHGCECALAIRDKLAARAPERAKEGRPVLEVRIGVNSGEVLVGNIGTNERFAYTALGDVVNLAARLESLNKFYGTCILAAGDVRDRTADHFVWRTIDRVAVVGRNSGTLVSELIGRKGTVGEPLLKKIATYESAVELYFQGRFTDAGGIFEELEKIWKNDRPTSLLLERCRRLIAEPPMDWRGIYVAAEK